MPIHVLAMVSAATLLAAEDPKAQNKTKQDIAKLQGTWNIATCEVEGAKVPEQFLKEAKIEIKGESFVSSMGGLTYKGTYKVDPTKSPRTMDLTFTEGPEKGTTSLAIYELDGDNWKICLTLSGKERPKEFATKAGSGLALESLKRQK